MTKQNLLDLAGRIEAGENIAHEIVAALNNAIVKPYPPSTDFGPSARWQFWSKDGQHFLGNERKLPVFDLGSLDAAKALHDAELPGWRCELRESYDGTWWDCHLTKRNEDFDECGYVSTESGVASAAAAWVSAILRAKAEEE